MMLGGGEMSLGETSRAVMRWSCAYDAEMMEIERRRAPVGQCGGELIVRAKLQGGHRWHLLLVTVATNSGPLDVKDDKNKG